MKLRKRITVYGEVQGVGFRYRASYAARSLGITGWVKNQWDGSVIMEVQGTEQEIDRMILMIQQGTYIQIRKMEVEKLQLEDEGSFQIR